MTVEDKLEEMGREQFIDLVKSQDKRINALESKITEMEKPEPEPDPEPKPVKKGVLSWLFDESTED